MTHRMTHRTPTDRRELAFYTFYGVILAVIAYANLVV